MEWYGGRQAGTIRTFVGGGDRQVVLFVAQSETWRNQDRETMVVVWLWRLLTKTEKTNQIMVEA